MKIPTKVELLALVKQAAGDLTNNSELHDEGAVDDGAARPRTRSGMAAEGGEGIEDIGNAIKN